jgi:hypothetical protein
MAFDPSRAFDTIDAAQLLPKMEALIFWVHLSAEELFYMP